MKYITGIFNLKTPKLKLRNSDHHRLCTIYSRVYHSFITYGTKKIQYMMNFNGVNVLSTYHSLFYITEKFIVGRFLQRSCQNHIGCGITFNTVSLSFLANSLCVNLMLFFEELKKRVIPRS